MCGTQFSILDKTLHLLVLYFADSLKRSSGKVSGAAAAAVVAASEDAKHQRDMLSKAAFLCVPSMPACVQGALWAE